MKIRVVFSIILLLTVSSTYLFAQDSAVIQKTFPDSIAVKDTIPSADSIPVVVPVPRDTILRITNLIPYITLHVDSTLTYKLDVNKAPENQSYSWVCQPNSLRHES